MENQCPECFGKKESYGKTPLCPKCEFAESCKFCSEDDGNSCNRRLGHVSYERFSYSEEIAEKPHPEQESVAPDDKDNSDIKAILDFLLDIDNYTAELLSEVLHGNVSTASELGSKFGVSRQAIHRKLVDCCTIHPELRKLFIIRLNRCRRLLTDSRRLKEIKKKKENPNQMEFKFNYDKS